MTSQRPTEIPVSFAQNYQRLLKRLKLRGMQPKTIESYSHGVRRAGAHFEYQIDNLSRDQLTDCNLPAALTVDEIETLLPWNLHAMDLTSEMMA